MHYAGLMERAERTSQRPCRGHELVIRGIAFKESESIKRGGLVDGGEGGSPEPAASYAEREGRFGDGNAGFAQVLRQVEFTERSIRPEVAFSKEESEGASALRGAQSKGAPPVGGREQAVFASPAGYGFAAGKQAERRSCVAKRVRTGLRREGRGESNPQIST